MVRGDPGVVTMIENAEAVFVPFVVISELRAGFAAGSLHTRNEEILERFLMKPGVEVLWPTDQTVRSYAGLFTQLRQQGTPIPTSDLWIAAIVIENGLALVTRDRHFSRIGQLHVL